MSVSLQSLTGLCIHCGRIPDFNRGFYCRDCWAQALSQKVLLRGISSGHPYVALWNWFRQNDEFCRATIMSLKEGRREGLRSLLADVWVTRLLAEQRPGGKPRVFVPAPSRRSHQFDHASALAAQLSLRLGGRVLPVLVREDERQQRAKSRRERLALTMKSSLRQPNVELRGCQVTFVDDVLTSGATAHAAYIALNRPSGFEIWVMAYRDLADRCDDLV